MGLIQQAAPLGLRGGLINGDTSAIDPLPRGELEKGFRLGLSGVGGNMQGAYASLQDALGFHDEAAARYAMARLEAERVARENPLAVANMTDINGLGDVLPWAAGALGQGLPSIGAGLAGAVGGRVGLGAAARALPQAKFLANPTLNTAAGSAAAMFPMEMGESAMDMAADPAAMANTTPMSRLGIASLKGGVNSVLESVVPTHIVGKAVTSAPIAAGASAALARVGRRAGEGMLGEFATEGAQNITGDIAQGMANPAHEIDFKAALNAGAAGAVAGGGMGALGGGAEALREKFSPAAGKSVTDTLADKTVSAVQGTTEALARGSVKAGDMVEKWLDRKEYDGLTKSPEFQHLVSHPTDEEAGQNPEATEQYQQGKVQAAANFSQGILQRWKGLEAKGGEGSDIVDAAVKFQQAHQSGQNVTLAAQEFGDALRTIHKLDRDTKKLNDMAPESGAKENAQAPDDGPESKLKELFRKEFNKKYPVLSGEAGNLRGAERYHAARDVAVDALFKFAKLGFTLREPKNGKLAPVEWPSRFEDALDKYSGTAVRSVANLLNEQGLLSDEYHKRGTELADKLDKGVLRTSEFYNSLKGKLGPFGRSHVNNGASIEKLANDLIQEGLPKEKLAYFFGKNADDAFRALSGYQELGGKLKADDSALKAAAGVDPDAPSTMVAPETVPVYHGVNGGKSAYNSTVPKHVTQMQAHKDALSEFHGYASDVGDVGVHDMHKQLAKTPEELREAEDALITKYGTKVEKAANANPARTATEWDRNPDSKVAGVENPLSRHHILGRINRDHRMLVSHKNSEQIDRNLTPEQVKEMRIIPNEKLGKGTAADGVIHFEQRDSRDDSKINKATYATLVGKLLAHVGGEPQGNLTSKARLAAVTDKLNAAIAALISSEGGNFTGRVGFIRKPGGAVEWLKKASDLPAELRISAKLTAGEVKADKTDKPSNQKWTDSFDLGEFKMQEIGDMVAEYKAFEKDIDDGNLGPKYALALARSKKAQSERNWKELKAAKKEMDGIVARAEKRAEDMEQAIHEDQANTTDNPSERVVSGQLSTRLNLEMNHNNDAVRVIDFAFGSEVGGTEIHPASVKEADVAGKQIAREKELKGFKQETVNAIAAVAEKGTPALMVAVKKVSQDSLSMLYDVMVILRKNMDSNMRAYNALTSAINYVGPKIDRSAAFKFGQEKSDTAEVAKVRPKELSDLRSLQAFVSELVKAGNITSERAKEILRSTNTKISWVDMTASEQEAVRNYEQAELKLEGGYTKPDAPIPSTMREPFMKLLDTGPQSPAAVGRRVLAAMARRAYAFENRKKGSPVPELTDARRTELMRELAGELDESGEMSAEDVASLYEQYGDYEADIPFEEETAPKVFKENAQRTNDPAVNVYWGANDNKHLSNLADRPFTYGTDAAGQPRTYRSVEHAYQTLKSGTFNQAAYDSQARKYMGRQRTKTAGDWNIRLMEQLMLRSFKQNPAAAKALLATGNGQITHTQDTTIWREKFPEALMRVRDYFVNQEQEVAPTGHHISNVPMYFPMPYNGVRSGLRQRYPDGSTTQRMMEDGERTASTRNHPIGNVGDTFSVKGSPTQYIITKTERINLDTQAARDAWSKKEGWDATFTMQHHAAQVHNGAWQTTFKKVENAQSDEQPSGVVQNLTPEEADKLAKAHVTSMGKHVDLLLAESGLLGEKSGKPISGDYNETEKLIRLSLFAKDRLGVLRHEHMHGFFTWLRKNGSKEVQAVLERVATNPMVMGQLKTWLATEKAAYAAATTDKEEAVAYMYQLWDKRGEDGAPLLHLGPKVETVFQKVKAFLTNLFGLTEQHVKDAAEVEKIFQALKRGDFADNPDAMVQALEKKLATSELAKKQGSAIANAVLENKFMREFIYSNWQVIKDTGNSNLINLSKMFHVAEGAKLEKGADGKTVQGSIDATKQEMNRRINTLTVMFRELYEGLGKEGVDAARKHLVAKTGVGAIHDPVMKKFIKSYREHLEDMHKYAVAAGVKRLDPESHEWVELGHIGDNYFHVNWDTDAVISNPDKFREVMKREHMKALEELVKDAELEREANKHTSKDAASRKVEGAITVDDILTAIMQHITNTNGQPDIQENTSNLGITPYAAAVNRRTLTFIKDYAPFDEFMNKDFAQTATNYAVQMVKRAEYVRKFGNGGDKIQDAMDRAYVEFLLGKDKVAEVEAAAEKSKKDLISKFGYAETMDRHHALVMQTLLQRDTKELKADHVAREVRLRAARKAMLDAEELWQKWGDSAKIGDMTYADLAEQKRYLVDLMTSEQQEIEDELSRRKKDGDETRTSAKGMRAIAEGMLEGTDKEKAQKIKEANAAMATPTKAIMAMEGTLGREISDTTRKLFQTVTAFQNVNKLVFTLFSSFVDPLGIIIRGGEVKDAFAGFARGLRMVKENWAGQHSPDGLEQLLQTMGVVEAGTYMDVLGETYSSQFAGSAKLHKFNNKFFKVIGMEAWNRAMRIQAGGVAMDFIKRHLTEPTEHSTRYLEELGLDPAGKATYLKENALDTDNPVVQQAVMKWVDGAVLNPNAAHRSIKASDPHMLLVYHLKQFTYSFHNVILRRVGVEMQHGNYVPLLTLSSYIPFMIAVDAMKATLLPGDEPAWMKSIGGALAHGAARAPIGGIPQLITDGLPFVGQGHPMSLFGPAAGQAADLLALPFSAHHTVLNEGLGLMPAGAQLRKLSMPPPDPDGGGAPTGTSAVLGSVDHLIAPVLQSKVLTRGR